MSTLIIAVVVLAHGLGHVLFLMPAVRLADWAGQTSHSWALTATLGDVPARGIAALIWTAAILLFTAGVAGFVTGDEWWRPIIIAAAIVSIGGLVLFWDGIATSSAVFALAFDVVVLVSLLVAHWPSVQTAGA
jgi:hypothetical protein